jgi:hypothetical protein
MRTLLFPLLAIAFALPASAQDASADSTGLPGDDFSLQGALDLFKNAKDLQSFEQSLNTEEQKVNNLDLDGNGDVDYIRVVDHTDGDAHAIVLQVAVSKEENQDVAVIELEKNGAASAMLQIRGAEELYGADVMVEPFEEQDAGTTPSKGPSAPELVRVRIWVNVWAWPCVTWIYSPSYVIWNSPWYWGYYPPYWHPWRPMGWRAWYGWHRPYRAWYRPAPVCTVVHAHTVYRPRAAYSPRIRTATAPVRQQRAAMRPAPVDRRSSGVRAGQRTMESRQPSTTGKDSRAPRTRPAQRAPRTQPAPRTPRQPRPARAPAPTRSPRNR